MCARACVRVCARVLVWGGVGVLLCGVGVWVSVHMGVLRPSARPRAHPPARMPVHPPSQISAVSCLRFILPTVFSVADAVLNKPS